MNYARRVSEADIQQALGPFDELEPIGDHSASGEAWRARRGTEQFAIKIIIREHEPGRVDREVAALKRLSSPRVMRLLERDDVTIGSETYPYLLAEYVEGENVAAKLAQMGPPDDSELRAFLVELLTALEELDAAGIVHRDLKPENIVLRAGGWGSPVVIDLGLSRLVDTASMTIYPWAFGTWPYAAPEQHRAERAIHQTDVWAAAVIAAELASGSHPWRQPGERDRPADWDQRLRNGIVVPGSRPAALRDFVENAGEYRAYRRPTAARARDAIQAAWV